jgi:hypothetical protein
MSFQDPPTRPRYPALGQYEEARPAPDYTDTFDGSGYQSTGSATGGWRAAQASYGGATQASYAPAAGYAGSSAGNAYAPGNGYASGDAGAYQGNGYQGANGYQAANGYQGSNGYQAGAEFGGTGGYSTATLQRPADNSWREDLYSDDEDWGRDRRQPASGGILAGALTGFLAVAVAIGVATLVAAFVRSQASPIMAAGQAFINHAPSSLKTFAVHSKHERKALFGVMYAIIAIIAMILGMIAQRKVAVGVLGIVLIGLFGAFVTIKQPGSRASDAVPAVIGAIAGVVALTFLIRSFYADNSTRAPARRRA